MPDSEMIDALQEIYPESVTVELVSGPVEMRPLTIMELGAISRAVRVIAASLNSSEDQLNFVEERAGDLVPFVAASSGIDKAELSKRYGGEFMQLFAGALDANLDFFGRCFALRYGSTGAKLVGMINGPGQPPSTTSETADIPSASDTRP
jgi:hypothetical protein